MSLIDILNALFSSILAILLFFDLFGSSQSDLVQSKEVDDIIIGAGCAHSFCATQNTVPSKVYQMFCPSLSPKHLILETPQSYFFFVRIHRMGTCSGHKSVLCYWWRRSILLQLLCHQLLLTEQDLIVASQMNQKKIRIQALHQMILELSMSKMFRFILDRLQSNKAESKEALSTYSRTDFVCLL